MILNLIKYALAMGPGIHGVSKFYKFRLSNYSLTYQLLIINLITAFIGFISLLVFNFYLIQDDRNILIEYDSTLLKVNKISNFLSNNAISRVPLFNENCDNNTEDQDCVINISEPTLDPTTTQQYIMQNYLQTNFDVIVYNDGWVKFADTEDMYISNEVSEIAIDAKIGTSDNFIDNYRQFYIDFFNKFRKNFIKNKYIKVAQKFRSEINLVSETIKNKKIIINKFYNNEKDIIQIISSPVLYNDKIYGVVIVSYPLVHNNYNLGLNSYNLFNFYIFLVLIILFISFFFSKSLVSPIRTLSKITLNERTKIKPKITFSYPVRGDEIGTLSNEIQKMSLDLKTQINQLEKFAADVSHELKNPLTSLQSANELILNDNIAEKDKDILNKNITKDIKRMNKLISDISNFTQIKAEIETESFEYININEFLIDVANSYNENKKNIKIEIETNDQKLYVAANKDKLSQVFYNLIDNSISILSKNQNVFIQSRSLDQKNIEIKVYDQGKGIPLKDAEKIFYRFYTDRDADKGDHSGLGLSISREIVNSFGGVIKLVKSDRQLYPGACFMINLPLKV